LGISCGQFGPIGPEKVNLLIINDEIVYYGPLMDIESELLQEPEERRRRKRRKGESSVGHSSHRGHRDKEGRRRRRSNPNPWFKSRRFKSRMAKAARLLLFVAGFSAIALIVMLMFDLLKGRS
jgi:hypothetical protein